MNTTTITNKVGLEAEFFVKKNGQLVLPRNYGFESDEYIILGEFRSTPGKTVSETVSNFLLEWYNTLEKAKRMGVEICIDPHQIITKKFHADVLREMGTKEISTSSNIYGTDILEDTDAVIVDGKIIGYYLSIGLHIHFSSVIAEQKEVTYGNEYQYTPVNLPVSLNNDKDVGFNLNLYKRSESKLDERKISCTASCNRITKPVIEHIVRTLDKEILPLYNPTDVKLKFRQPGFYEIKPDGRFEYRSLPMSQRVLTYIYDITGIAFKLLDDL